MLRVARIDVRCKKGERGGNVKASESRQPVYTAKNTLIDLFLTWKIRIEGFNKSNGVNGEPGAIRSHVGDLVVSVNRETMSSKFSELLLEYMEVDVPVSVVDPSRGST